MKVLSFETIAWWVGLLSGVWLMGAASVLATAWFSDSVDLPWQAWVYLGLTVLASIVCFAAYGIDKRRAVKQRPRIPGRVLHLLALFGGWPGAVLARRFFRHKTQKITFRLVLWLTIALHAVIIFYVGSLLFTG